MDIKQQLERRKSHLKNLNEKIKLEKNKDKIKYFEKIKRLTESAIKELELKYFMRNDPYINEFEENN